MVHRTPVCRRTRPVQGGVCRFDLLLQTVKSANAQSDRSDVRGRVWHRQDRAFFPAGLRLLQDPKLRAGKRKVSCRCRKKSCRVGTADRADIFWSYCIRRLLECGSLCELCRHEILRRADLAVNDRKPNAAAITAVKIRPLDGQPRGRSQK